MKHVLAIASALACVLVTTAAQANFGDPVPGLTAAQLAQFNAGKDVFVKVDEVVADGLGPVFNEAACSTCHNTPVGGTVGRVETRFGRSVGGVFDPLVSEGGSLRQDHGIGTGPGASVGPPGVAGGIPGTQSNAARIYFLPIATAPNAIPLPANCNPDFVQPAEVVPADANVVALRRTTALFGFGFIDTISPATVQFVSDLEFFLNPFTAGIPARMNDPDTGLPTIGKFGWKAQVPTIHAFSGDAYLNEMGVTNPAFPAESCPQGDCSTDAGHPLACNPFPALNDDGGDVNNFTNFMRFLDKPARGFVGIEEQEGERLFDIIGCSDCHRLEFYQTPTVAGIPALSNQLFRPFSDFLLHDMDGTGDGITQNNATGRLMRTAPLWGIRLQRTQGTGLMHDGQSHTFRDAINRHHGQAELSRLLFFFALSPGGQDDVIQFLFSL